MHMQHAHAHAYMRMHMHTCACICDTFTCIFLQMLWVKDSEVKSMFAEVVNTTWWFPPQGKS